MSLSLSELTALGIPEDKANLILRMEAASAEETAQPEVAAAPAPQAAVTAEVSIAEFNQMKADLAAEKAARKRMMADFETRERAREMRSAVREQLLKTGAIDPEVVMSQMNLSKITMDEVGTISGLKEETERVYGKYSYLWHGNTLQQPTQAPPEVQGMEPAQAPQEGMIPQQGVIPQQGAVPQQQGVVPQQGVIPQGFGLQPFAPQQGLVSPQGQMAPALVPAPNPTVVLPRYGAINNVQVRMPAPSPVVDGLSPAPATAPTPMSTQYKVTNMNEAGRILGMRLNQLR